MATSATRQVAFIAGCLFLLMFPVTGMVPVLQEITQDRFTGISDFDKHLFMSVNMIGAFLFVPLIGIISDRFKMRKPIIAGAYLLNGVILFMMRYAETYNQFLTLRFLEGCMHITSLSLLMTLAADHVKSLSSGKIMGLVGSSISLGVAVGSPIGGRIGQQNPDAIFFGGGILMICVGVFAFISLKDTQIRSLTRPIRHLLSSLKQKKELLIPYVFTFIDRLTVGFIISTLTFYLRLELGATPAEIGVIMAIFLVPFAFLIYPFGRISEKRNKLLMMTSGSILYGVLLTTIGFVDLGTIKWLMLTAGVASAMMYAPSLVMVARMAGDDDKAMAMGGYNSAGSIGFIIGPLFGGAIVGAIVQFGGGFSSYETAFLLIGGLEVLCGLIFLPLIKRYAYVN